MPRIKQSVHPTGVGMIRGRFGESIGSDCSSHGCGNDSEARRMAEKINPVHPTGVGMIRSRTARG